MPPSSALVSMKRPQVSRYPRLARQPTSRAGTTRKNNAKPAATPQVEKAHRRPITAASRRPRKKSTSCRKTKNPTGTTGTIFIATGKANTTPPAVHDNHAAGKGDSPHLCAAPFGPFRRAPTEGWSGTVPFSGARMSRNPSSRRYSLTTPTCPRCKQLSVGSSAVRTAAAPSQIRQRAQAAAAIGSDRHTSCTMRRHSRQHPQQNKRLRKNQTVTWSWSASGWSGAKSMAKSGGYR